RGTRDAEGFAPGPPSLGPHIGSWSPGLLAYRAVRPAPPPCPDSVAARLRGVMGLGVNAPSFARRKSDESLKSPNLLAFDARRKRADGPWGFWILAGAAAGVGGRSGPGTGGRAVAAGDRALGAAIGRDAA